jgi:hypothetical protein
LAQQFVSCASDCFLVQHTRNPTHHRRRLTSTLIDLVLTNKRGTINHFEHEAPLGCSHHDLLAFSYNWCTARGGDLTTSYLHNRGGYQERHGNLPANFWSGNSDEALAVFEQGMGACNHLKTRTLQRESTAEATVDY